VQPQMPAALGWLKKRGGLACEAVLSESPVSIREAFPIYGAKRPKPQECPSRGQVANDLAAYPVGHKYSNLRFYCPLNGGQSPPTDNKRQGTLGIHLLCKWIRKALTPIISTIFIPMFRRPEFRCCRVPPASKSLHSSSTTKS